MNKTLYKRSAKTLGTRPLVSIKSVDKDYVKDEIISGAHGWISQSDKDATKLTAYMVQECLCEKIIPFNIKDLNVWFRRIGVSVGGSLQADFANNPSTRYHEGKIVRKCKFKKVNGIRRHV